MIRIGVIGCGYWGPLHIRVLHEIDGAAVTAVADLNPARLDHIAATYPGLHTTPDVDDLLASDVDAVVIATPAGTHASLATAALKARKHVLVEKPLATSTADAEALALLAERAGRRLMAGHTFVYHAAVRALRELIGGGVLGDIYYVDSKRVNLGLHRKDVDVVWDLGTHDVSILRYLLDGDAERVSAHGAAFHSAETAEVAYVQLRYPGGVLANLHVSWLDPVKVRRMTVVGSRRMAVWDDVEPVQKLRLYDRGLDRRPYHDDFGQWQVAYRHGDEQVVPLDFKEPLRLEAEEFLSSIREGRSSLTGAEDGIAVVRTLEQITAAMQPSAAIWSGAGVE
ncbi:MAG: Gfo/Idh/MocA family protein [Dehalococcoidia bacterium]